MARPAGGLCNSTRGRESGVRTRARLTAQCINQPPHGATGLPLPWRSPHGRRWAGHTASGLQPVLLARSCAAQPASWAAERRGSECGFDGQPPGWALWSKVVQTHQPSAFMPFRDHVLFLLPSCSDDAPHCPPQPPPRLTCQAAPPPQGTALRPAAAAALPAAACWAPVQRRPPITAPPIQLQHRQSTAHVSAALAAAAPEP